MRRSLFLVVFAGVLALNASPAPAQVVSSGTLTGRLVNSLSGDPIPGATVVLEELRRQVQSGADAVYVFQDVPPGSYHVSVRADGYSPRRTEVKVARGETKLDLAVDPELHFAETISVGAEPRSTLEAYQPTSVLAGQELLKQLGGSLGETLSEAPGVATRSLGPGPSRPVIRGLDGDRVLILEDGQRMGDLSSQSGDHGVVTNPAAAQKIEVVRGPATLLYGANAIGGLVNVITDQVPTRKQSGLKGGVLADFGTGARDGGGAADVHWGNGTWALHAGGTGRGSGDVRTPAGTIENTQSRSGSASVGLSWTGEKTYLGGSYGYDSMRYGVPVIEEGAIELTPRRHQLTLRSGGRDLSGFLTSYRATLALRRYRHDEIEDGSIGTRFENDTSEVEFLGGHRKAGRLAGSFGGWFLDRAFGAFGEERLSPPVDQRGVAAFMFEELAWSHVTLQFGARLEHQRFRPTEGLPPRDFTDGSWSIGGLFRPGAAHDRLTIAASLAQAARNPALEELYYFGNHAGNVAFEIGNPSLDSERGLGFDVSVRWTTPRLSGEVTYFRNDVGDFIYRRPLGEEEFAERFPDVDAEFPPVEFTAADSLLEGIEAHMDAQLMPVLFLELGLDSVRGSLSATGEPLPRMPPLRGRVGLRYQKNALQAGGEVLLAADQNRVAPAETPTAGYALLRLFGSYSFPTGKAVSTLTARLDNATNELYRNHLSYVKDQVPEMGRSFKLLYSVEF